MGTPVGVIVGRLPRLLYIGDVAVADTVGGESLLFRLLQFYPPDQLAIVCAVRPDMPRLPGVAYHHYGAAYPRLLTSRVAEEYCLWHAWKYYNVPAAIAAIAARFKPDAILTISHVSGWLGGWQLAHQRRIPLHLIAHDDFVYADRFPRWSRAWATRKFGEAYRAAHSRFCISDTMAEVYEQRFGAPGLVIYPTTRTSEAREVSPRVTGSSDRLTFGYGGSINSAADIDQMISFARAAGSRGHRLLAYTPQYQELAGKAGDAAPFLDARAPVPSAELTRRFREEADCLILPQSMSAKERPMVATAFPTKWADYSSLGLPVLVWAPPGSSAVRFVGEHPHCAELVTSAEAGDVDQAIVRIASSADHRRRLAETLLEVGRRCFAPEAAWERFRSSIAGGAVDVVA